MLPGLISLILRKSVILCRHKSKKEKHFITFSIFKECYQNHFSNFIVIKKEKHFITFSNS